MQSTPGVSSVGTQNTLVAHLRLTTTLHPYETDRGELVTLWRDDLGSPANQRQREQHQRKSNVVYGKKGKSNKGKKGKDKGKENTGTSKRTIPSLRATAVTMESERHKQKDCVDTGTLWRKLTRRKLWIKRAEVRAAARTESLLHLLVCLQLEMRSPRRG